MRAVAGWSGGWALGGPRAEKGSPSTTAAQTLAAEAATELPASRSRRDNLPVSSQAQTNSRLPRKDGRA